MGGISKWNAEHYSDPTAYQALQNIQRTEREKVWAFLRRLSDLREIIESKTAEKEIYDAQAEGLGGSPQDVLVEVAPGKFELQAPPKVQSSGDKQRMANAKNQSIDLEREIAEHQKMFDEHAARVIEVISKLPFNEYDVLYKEYVKGFELKDIAYIRKKSYSWVTTTKNRAVSRLQKILVL